MSASVGQQDQQGTQQGALPLQNTGVPTAQQVQDPNKDTLSLLTALGGLGLNVAGAVTRGGPGGNQALNFATSRYEDLQKQQKQAAKAAADAKSDAADAAADAQEQADAQKRANTFLPLIQRIGDPAKQAVAKEMINQGDYKSVQAYIEKLQSDANAAQHLALAQQTHNVTLANMKAGALDKAAKGLGDTEQQLQKAVNPVVAKNVAIAQQLVPELSTKDLQNPGNFQVKLQELKSKGNFDVTMNKQEAEALRQQLLDAAQNQDTSSHVFGFKVPFTGGLPDKLDPNKLGDAFLKKSGIDANDIQQHVGIQQQIQAVRQQRQALDAQSENIRLKAAGGAGLPSRAAVAAPAPKAQRFYSPSTGKYFIKGANGKVVPE